MDTILNAYVLMQYVPSFGRIPLPGGRMERVGTLSNAWRMNISLCTLTLKLTPVVRCWYNYTISHKCVINIIITLTTKVIKLQRHFIVL